MYVIECLQAAGDHVVTHVLSKSEKFGACCARRWRLYFLGLRVPKAIANDTVELPQITQSIHDFCASMTIGSGNFSDFLNTSDSVNLDASGDDELAAVSSKRQKKMAMVMCAMVAMKTICACSGNTLTPQLV